jgi:AraC family transcriptional regulator
VAACLPPQNAGNLIAPRFCDRDDRRNIKRTMSATASAAAMSAAHPAQLIGALAQQTPESLFTAAANATPVAAIWAHAPVDTEVAGLTQHAIALHLSGCTLVEKWSGGRCVASRSRIGSVSLVAAQRSTRWVLSGHSRVAHLYIDPKQLARFNAALDRPLPSVELRDFFAQTDQALAALVQLVIDQPGVIDALAHDQLMCVVYRHLLAHYAQEGFGSPPTTPRSIALTTATLKRLFDHIDANFHAPLTVRELAAIARLSDDHFLRAFKVAVGQTPHQYVVSRRIAAAKLWLHDGTLPLAEIATRSGFASASHFAAAFRKHTGASPSRWRSH